MKNYKLLVLTLILFIAFISISLMYIGYIQEKKTALETHNFSKEARSISDNFHNLILEKQNSTLAIAISLADDPTLLSSVKKHEIDKNKYTKLSQDYRNSTLYKNIWIQVLDNKGISLYRSWDTRKGDSLLHHRSELKDFFSKKQYLKTISVGKYDLSLKSIVPMMDDEKIIGAVEVISHFNSISRLMKSVGQEAIMVVNEEYTKRLKFPFTKLFIDNKYYIANVDAKEDKLEYLSSHGVENYFKDGYKVENGYVIVTSFIKDINNDVLGYAIIFEKEELISTLELEFFIFKWISALVIILLTLISLFSLQLLLKNRSQKSYYKNILDATTNLLLINNKEKILDVNRTFFKYFTQYKTLDEFRVEHQCICEFFVEEEGYLHKEMDGLNWVEYLLQSKEMNHKVKMKIEDEIYFFFLNASSIPEAKEKFILVFSDITTEEEYLSLSLTDELTNIGNRRYFNTKLTNEISRENRHKHKLSLIMLDIDFFKRVNDVHGHDIGDEVLSKYSALILKQLRNEDIFCRVGGEEFIIILPYTDKENAKNIAEKIRVEVQESKLVVPITMSFGVVEYIHNETQNDFYKRADTALYFAKENGRNMVVVG